MDNLLIYGTSRTPTINFNYSEGLFLISGISIPEDSLTFYDPIIKWLKEYLEHPQQGCKIVLKFTYLNTSSLQAIYELFELLENKPIEIEWYYFSEDDTMKETGEDFMNSVNVNMSLKEVIEV